MPIRPKPFKVICQQCQWSRVLQPLSDAVTPNERVERCPVCGSKKINFKKPNWFERLFT